MHSTIQLVAGNLQDVTMIAARNSGQQLLTGEQVAQVISHSSCYGCMAPLVLGKVLLRKAVQRRWRQKTNSVLRFSSPDPISEIILIVCSHRLPTDLIMRQIPPNTVSMVRKILLLNHIVNWGTFGFANILGRSREEFYSYCGFLQSVLFLKPETEDSYESIQYYHAAFMEYMVDPGRSKNFYIYGDVVQELYQEMIQRLNDVHGSSKGMRQIIVVCLIELDQVHDRINASCQYHISPFKAP